MNVLKPRPKPHSRRRVRDNGQALSGAILRMPPDLRDVFLLNRMAGLTYEQTGFHLGIAPEAVQAKLAAALVRLTRVIRASEA